MKQYINSYIDTLPNGDRMEAKKLLHKASLEKKEIGKLLKRLTEDFTIASSNFTKTRTRSVLSGDELSQNFADLSTRMRLFYTITNSITDLLDSESITILSEIRDLEKELDYIEKSVANYAFTLSNGGSFNFAFIDSFSDYINVASDIDFNIPDRDGSYFTDEEQALIDLQEDVLKMSPVGSFGVGITASVSEVNFVTNNAFMSDIENLTVVQKDTGWRVTTNSPIPITGTIDGLVGMHGVNAYGGAQVELEVTPSQPSPCDNITLSPLSSSSVDVIQIRLFLDEDYSTSVDLLDSVEKISSQSTFYFEIQTVYKVLVYLRQSTYTRPILEPSIPEQSYRDLFMQQRNLIKYDSLRKRNRVRNLVPVSQVFVKNFIREKRGLNKIAVRNYNRRLGTGKWGPMDDSLEPDRVSLNARNRGDWFKTDKLGEFTELLVDYKQFSEQLTRDRFPRRNESTRRPNPFYNFLNTSYIGQGRGSLTTSARGSVNVITGRIRSVQKPLNRRASFYRYEIGLNHISLGVESKPSKAAYVSRLLPSTGDIGELRLRESSVNAKYTSNPNYDINTVTSVEYSVTTVARPDSEDDWFPILPAGQPEVVAERLYFDDSGRAFLRFPAQKADSLFIYKNNVIFPVEEYVLVTALNQTQIIGIDLDITSVSITDIFTASYTPFSDAGFVNFENLNFNKVPLVASFDDSGTGEGFDSLNGQLTVTLQNEPYINAAQVDSATYSPASGLTYRPITVELQDGTNAINLTNYQGGTQTNLSSEDLSLSFINKGKYLIFNKDINQPFRIFYQYLPKNLRVRIILRSNFAGSNLTPKVNFYQVKGKIRQANSRLLK